MSDLEREIEAWRHFSLKYRQNCAPLRKAGGLWRYHTEVAEGGRAATALGVVRGGGRVTLLRTTTPAEGLLVLADTGVNFAPVDS